MKAEQILEQMPTTKVGETLFYDKETVLKALNKMEGDVEWTEPCKDKCLEIEGLEGTEWEGTIGICDDGCVRSRPIGINK